MSGFKNSYYKKLIANQNIQGQPQKIQGIENTIKITIQTDVSGTLYVYQSIDGRYYEHFDDVFNVLGSGNYQVSVKGLSYYIKYINGNEDTTDFKLYSFMATTINNNIDVKLTSDDIVSINGLNFDTSGNLLVSEIGDTPSNLLLIDILNKAGDIKSNFYYDDSAQVWADTVPMPTKNDDYTGWSYKNTGGPPQAMNYYYMSGFNETTLTLGSIMGQYCHIRNNSTQPINKMILAKYSQGTEYGWYKSRVTHSNYASKMAPLGEYLLYWGSVPDNIYPNLQRIELSNETITGTGISTENLLTVSIASDSEAAANAIDITIFSLGAVVNGVTRTYELLNTNDYILLKNVSDNLNKLKFNGDLLKVDAVFPEKQNVQMYGDYGGTSTQVSVSQFGYLNTNSTITNAGFKMLDSSSNPINSTTSALDVYVKNPTLAVSGNVSITGTVNTVCNNDGFQVWDALNNPINSTNSALNVYVDNQLTTLSVSNFPSTQAVTGDFYPATQPVSGTLTTRLQDGNGNNINSTTNSLDVNIKNVSLPVTGTFYQATQPVSGTLTTKLQDGNGNNINSTTNSLDVNIKNASLPVTGTFYQATQPVSGTLTTKLQDGNGNNINSDVNRLTVYDASANSLLGKNNYDASMNLLVMPARTMPANYGCFYFSVTSAVGGGSFSPVFCDTSTFTLAGTGSPGLYSVGTLSYIPKGASVTIGITHASQSSVNHQLCPAASDVSGNYTTNGYAIGGLNTYSSAYQVTQCGKWTYPNGVPRYIGFYNNSSGGSISGVKVSISFVY